MKKNVIIPLIGCSLLFLARAQSLQAMGRVPKEEHEALKNEYAAQQKASDSKIQELQASNVQLLKDLESNKGELQKRVAELTKEKRDAEQAKETVEKEKAGEVEKLKSTYDNLVQDMKKEISQGSIQITQLQDKLSVSLVDKIVFDSGESALNAQGRAVLKKVANVLKKVSGKQIRIEGHTDNIPIGGSLKEKYPSNWELSTARATSVARYLQDEGGIDPQVLLAAGYGPYRPVADNASPEGRSKNRRIEIALVPLETASATPLSSTQMKTPAAPQKPAQ